MKDLTQETEDFKTKIDLGKIMEQRYGYDFDKKKSNVSYDAYTKGDKKSAEREVLLVKKMPNGHQMYINPMDTADRGTVIDLVMKRDGLNMRDTAEVLRKEMGSKDFTRAKEVPINRAKTEELKATYFRVKPLNDTSLLERRGISKETYQNSVFKGTFGNRESTFKGVNGEITYNNLAFPLKNEKGTVGLDLKNDGFKGSLKGSNKANAVWRSRLPKLESKPTMIITESPIDAMAHNQIKKTPNPLYVATNGHLTQGQMHVIKKLIAEREPKKIILANDNDKAGKMFNGNLIGRLDGFKKENGNKDVDVIAHTIQESKTTARTDLYVRHENGPGVEKFERELKSNLIEANKGHNGGTFPRFFLEKTKMEQDSEKVKELYSIRFADNKSNMEVMEKTIMKVRDIDENRVSIDVAKGKDFAEDLQQDSNKQKNRQQEQGKAETKKKDQGMSM